MINNFCECGSFLWVPKPTFTHHHIPLEEIEPLKYFQIRKVKFKITHISIEHKAGLSIRSPFLSKSKRTLTDGIEGYGVPPRVMISHSNIP
jgi:hypothetical protein